MRKAAEGYGSGSGVGVAKTAQGRTVKHGVSRLLPYAPYPLWWVGSLAIAIGGWAWWGGEGGSMFYPVAVWTAHLGGAWVSRQMTKHKGWSDTLVALSQASFIASGLLAVVVGVLGPVSWAVSGWLGVGGSLVGYWTIRRMHLTGDAAATQQAASNTAQKILDSLNGAKAGNPQVLETGVVEIPVEVNRGEQAVSELETTVKDIEQVAKLRPGAGRLVPDPEDSGQAVMRFFPMDILKGMQPWPGPSAFGQSITLPIPIARRLDYSMVNIHLTADPTAGRMLAQWLVMGMSGAGKSAFFRTMMGEILTRNDVTVWAHDHVKGLQTLKPVIEGGGLDWVSMDLANGKAMLAATKAIIRQRARWMGANDFDEWVPDCGLNLLVVWFEEATELGSLRDLATTCKEARSVGVVIFISMQRAVYSSLDTETRAQLAGNVCFGVESSQDAMFGLSDEIRERGAEPQRWKNARPGYCYIDAPGIEAEQAAIEARVLFADKAALTDTVRRGAVVRRPLDELSVKAAGKAYADKLPGEAYLPGHPLFAKATGLEIEHGSGSYEGAGVRGSGVVAADPVHGRVFHGSEGVTDGLESVVGPWVENDSEPCEENEQAVSDTLNEVSEYPQVPDLRLAAMGKPVEQLTPDECRARIQVYLASVHSAGRKTIGVPDILRMTPPIRFKREWIRTELKRLCSGGADTCGWRLHEDEEATGVYAIVAPVGGRVEASVGLTG